MRQGKFAEAAEDYGRALERAPDADLYQHRGWAHFFADAWQLALRDFNSAIERDPAASDAYTGRGLARVMLKNYRGAVVDADAALARAPRTPEMMHNIACIFAQAAPCAEADAPASDKQVLAANYRRRAIAAVRATLAMLRPEERAAFWQEKIVPDTALAPIRGMADFEELHETYAKGGKRK
jgi:tetratricopeptide (TPR) repeat protein